MRARVSHAGESDAGVPLTRRFNEHLVSIMMSDARNPEVQNRHSALRLQNRLGPNLSFSGNEANPFFHNTGKGFVEIGTTMGISRIEDSRGFVLTDLDGDGALDVVLHNHFRNPLVALVNRAAGENRWVRLRLRGRTSNRFGIGARVTVNGKVRELSCGSGYLSCHGPELHVGLGKIERAEVRVRWPSGKTDAYEGLEAGRVHTLVEGEPAARKSEELRRSEVAVREAPLPEVEPDVPGILQALDPAGGSAPRIVVFFSASCLVCKADMLRAAEFEKSAAEKGVRLLWVATDPDFEKVEEELKLLRVAVTPKRPPGPLPPVGVPAAYVVDGNRVDKFTGRHAVTAAVEAAVTR